MAQQQNTKAQRDANKANAKSDARDRALTQSQHEDVYGVASQSRRDREDAINAQVQGRFEGLRQENLGRLKPYGTAGQRASEEQQALLGLSGSQEQNQAMKRFSESPGQKFLRDRQEKALLRSSAAIGGLGGGNVRTALQDQAFGRAQTDYDNQFRRLSGLSGQGLEASQTAAQISQQPEYIQTGQDKGVIDFAAKHKAEAAAAAEAKRLKKEAAIRVSDVTSGGTKGQRPISGDSNR
jgi:hypothetical protein